MIRRRRKPILALLYARATKTGQQFNLRRSSPNGAAAARHDVSLASQMISSPRPLCLSSRIRH